MPGVNRWYMLVVSRLDRPRSLLDFESLFEILPESPERTLPFNTFRTKMEVCLDCKRNLEQWRSKDMEQEIRCMKKLSSFL